MNKAYYLTTAIDYANGSPHLGHAYEKILADVIIRTKRLNGITTHFVTVLMNMGKKFNKVRTRKEYFPKKDVIELLRNSKICSLP